MTAIRITYVGTGLSGRATSLASVLTASGHPINAAAIRTTTAESKPVKHQFELEIGRHRYVVAASVSWVRSWLWYENATVPNLDPRIMAEIDGLCASSGLIFVVDSRPVHFERNLEALEKLRDDMKSRGQDPDQFPIVFQVNRRDAVDVTPLETIQSYFKARRCAYVESVASRGIGTVEAVKQLIALVTAEGL